MKRLVDLILTLVAVLLMDLDSIYKHGELELIPLNQYRLIEYSEVFIFRK